MLKKDQSITGSDMSTPRSCSDAETLAVISEQLADVRRFDAIVLERVRPLAVPVGQVGGVGEPGAHPRLVFLRRRQSEVLVDAGDRRDRVVGQLRVADVADRRVGGEWVAKGPVEARAVP